MNLQDLERERARTSEKGNTIVIVCRVSAECQCLQVAKNFLVLLYFDRHLDVKGRERALGAINLNIHPALPPSGSVLLNKSLNLWQHPQAHARKRCDNDAEGYWDN